MEDRYYFRGKRIDNSEWVCSGNLLYFVDDGYYIPQAKDLCETMRDKNDNVLSIDETIFYKVDSDTLGQCAGLKDKNGRLIFEGDLITIVGYSYYEPEIDITGEVIMGDCIGVGIIDLENNEPHSLWEMRGSYLTEYEIIGNIYDNPELLKEETE